MHTDSDLKNSRIKLLISNANLAEKISDNLIRINTTWELVDQFSKNQKLIKEIENVIKMILIQNASICIEAFLVIPLEFTPSVKIRVIQYVKGF